ncbi:MAG: hypothetical protein WC073_01405 [Sterolibacterium sp.]
MDQFQTFDAALLNGAGLNRQAVFNIDDLPAEAAESVRACATAGHVARQLILLGHSGTKLWDCVKASGIESENPIDDFSIQAVERWFAACHPENSYQILYPGVHRIGLQQLGQLAGWHHATPFMVGIDREWGTWYAYRAVVLADTAFEPTPAVVGESVCKTCQHRVCIASCPGSALDDGEFNLEKCVAYRKQDGSGCKSTCLARISCPVGRTHRYCDEQIRHTYSISMRCIERYY